MRWGRGCGFLFGLALASTPCFAGDFAVPSGQDISLIEVLLDDEPGETWARFRFLAPKISRVSGRISYDVAVIDMEALCNGFVLHYLDEWDLTVARISVSLSDQAIDFGASDPDVTQFFELYRRDGTACVWEEF